MKFIINNYELISMNFHFKRCGWLFDFSSVSCSVISWWGTGLRMMTTPVRCDVRRSKPSISWMRPNLISLLATDATLFNLFWLLRDKEDWTLSDSSKVNFWIKVYKLWITSIIFGLSVCLITGFKFVETASTSEEIVLAFPDQSI